MKPSFLLFSLLLVLVHGGSVRAFAASSSNSLVKQGWLAFGDMRGYFEPCGCDPEADLGGIQRIATFIKRERAMYPNFYLFNLGNNLPVQMVRDYYKVPYIEEGLASLGLAASLVNELELSNLKLIAAEYRSAQNFVLSNMRSKFKNSSIKSKVTTNGVEVYGYMYRRKFSKVLFSDEKKLMKIWKASSKVKSSAHRVLLFSGSAKELFLLNKSKFFGLIISSNQNSLNQIVGPEEKGNPGKLYTNEEGIRMVPVGGQGFLRGGRLTKVKSKSLKELLGQKKECSNPLTSGCSDSDGRLIKLENHYPVTWLNREFKDSESLVNLYKRYENAGQKAFKGLSESRKADLKSSPFIGGLACKGCHAKAYEVWSKSSHHHALNTLKKINKNRDPECVSCHVLGYRDKGGFVSEADSPQFADVQCENCHGPRKRHVQNPKVYPKKKVAAKATCVSCHHGTHTADFDFNQYWPKIKH